MRPRSKRGSLLVRKRQGRPAPRDRDGRWGWEQLRPWLAARVELRSGRCSASSTARVAGDRGRAPTCASSFCRLAAQAGTRRRFAPHQLRHARAVELSRAGVPLNVIQRQLGHANLGITSIYLQGIDTDEMHCHRPRQARTDDVGHRRTPALTSRPADSGSAADAPAARAGPRTASAISASVTSARAGFPSPPSDELRSSGGAVPRLCFAEANQKPAPSRPRRPVLSRACAKYARPRRQLPTPRRVRRPPPSCRVCVGRRSGAPRTARATS